LEETKVKKALKVISLVLALAMVFAFAACSNGGNDTTDAANNETQAGTATATDYSKIKFGLICLHDENSTYDNNFIEALKSVQTELGLSDEQVLIKTNIPETDECLSAAEELVDEGCNIIFADSFGHETYIIQAAEEFPEVQFCHATGTQAKQKNLANYHNGFASIYQGRYLAGVAAGLKLNEMIADGKITAEQAVMGYVGAFNYAEVVSGFTSFYLGAKSVCPSVTMKVTYTNSWFDIALEREAALSLINDGCVLISQHADSEGAPKACEEKGVPNVAYNIDTSSMGPNTAIISSKINWAPYYKLAINAVAAGESFDTDWCGTIETGSVELTALNTAVAAEGTQEKLDEVKEKLVSGEIKVFDTANFTVNGETLTEYQADVDGDYAPDTNVIIDGIFEESNVQFRSAPYFDIKYIDGITEK
jgi:basic membrane protein A and related proteins